MKQHIVSLKIYTTMPWVKEDLDIRSPLNSRRIYPQQQIKPKNLYGFTHHAALIFQQILVKIY